jgi:hypothetical protein
MGSSDSKYWMQVWAAVIQNVESKYWMQVWAAVIQNVELKYWIQVWAAVIQNVESKYWMQVWAAVQHYDSCTQFFESLLPILVFNIFMQHFHSCRSQCFRSLLITPSFNILNLCCLYLYFNILIQHFESLCYIPFQQLGLSSDLRSILRLLLLSETYIALVS